MRYIFILFCTLVGGVLHAQPFNSSFIKPAGKTIQSFIPDGWQVLDSTFGDLNKDALADAAIVLQRKDAIAIPNESSDTAFGKPRELLILFKKPNGDYELMERNALFIPMHDDPSMDDPYQSFSIDKGILSVFIGLFYNQGSWYITNATYKFRYGQKRFLLIGADKFSIHRATHDIESYSYNFVTGQRIIVTGNDDKPTQSVSRKKIVVHPLKTLKTLRQAFTWPVEPNVYL